MDRQALNKFQQISYKPGSKTPCTETYKILKSFGIKKNKNNNEINLCDCGFPRNDCFPFHAMVIFAQFLEFFPKVNCCISLSLCHE